MQRAWPRQVIFVLFLAVLLFAPAGTLHDWRAWLFLFVFVGSSVALGVYFSATDPALIQRRMRAGPRAEREPVQKVIISIVLLGFFLLVLVPGFDRHWHWSDVPTWLVLLAEAGIITSFAIFFAVMKQNSYAAATVQVEADQPVISTGLYGVVRHPMYAGALLMTICTPLALGSYWSLLLVVVLVPALAWRLIDEERYLARHLPGYRDYCLRTRSRLVPGVW